jgi:hypothetical protein
MRLRRNLSRQDYIRSRSIPEPNSGCWLWEWTLGNTGYACGAGGSSSRLSYRAFKGPVPDGCHVDHVCRTPACVNPDHLRVLSVKENLALRDLRKNNWNIRKKSCPRGHPYDEQNTIHSFQANGRPRRGCRECNRARSLRNYYLRSSPARVVSRDGGERADMARLQDSRKIVK